MLAEFPRWWGERLAELLPARIRTGGAAGPDALVFDWRDDAEPPRITVAGRKGGRIRAEATIHCPAGEPDPAWLVQARAVLGRFDARGVVVLRPPARTMLERQVILPLAAARDPARVLRYDMDRLTPFNPEDIAWTCAVAARDRARGQILLRLSLVPRSAIQPALDLLARLGARPDRLEVPGPDGAIRAIPLAGPDPARARRERRRMAVCGGVCAALALTAVALPFIRQQLAEADLDARIAALRPRVAEVEAVRRRVANEAAGGDAVAAELTRTGDPIAALAAVTAALPDDTFLREFSLTGRKLTLNGQSAAASRLIAALAADPAIRDPAFAAPITRAPETGAEMFSIHAELRP